MTPNAKKWRNRTKEDYAALFEAVRCVVHQIDPYELLAQGCPADEFDTEIKVIVRQIDRINSPQDATFLISRVLSHYFSADKFPPEECREAGAELHRVLKERNLLL